MDLTFEQIEDAFPEMDGCYDMGDGYVRVSAQWLHEFARNLTALPRTPPDMAAAWEQFVATLPAPARRTVLDAVERGESTTRYAFSFAWKAALS